MSRKTEQMDAAIEEYAAEIGDKPVVFEYVTVLTLSSGHP